MKHENDLSSRVAEALHVDTDEHAMRKRLREALTNAHAADIADALETLENEDRSRVLFALDPHTVAEVVIMLGEATRGDVMEDLDVASVSEIVSELPPDDAADVLGELSAAETDEILEYLPDNKSEPIEQLLLYGDETAGGIMTPEIVKVPATATVADAVTYVRDAVPYEDLNDIFIVDEGQRLIGCVPLRRLVTNTPSAKLIDLCDRDVVTVYALDDQETVLQVIRKYDALEAVVIDDQRRLLGRITHDDLQDVAEEEAAEDLLRMAGTELAEFEKQSVFHAARIRLTWLLPCMFGMLATATVLIISAQRFDQKPEIWIALGFFVPMIGAMGGNSGIQISTVIVRTFATGAGGRLRKTFLREGRIALVMSLPCGLLAFMLVWLSLPLLNPSVPSATVSNVATAVGLAMCCAIASAAILGITLPYLFRYLGVDPAIASGPLVTTLNDVVSVAIYMTIAMLLIL
ncbi:MAG: magnesium transporter [Phycisphaerae bacterium]